jgi:hypothetical protein
MYILIHSVIYSIFSSVRQVAVFSICVYICETRIGNGENINSRFRPGFSPIFDNPPEFRQTPDAVIRIKNPKKNIETSSQSQLDQSER